MRSSNCPLDNPGYFCTFPAKKEVRLCYIITLLLSPEGTCAGPLEALGGSSGAHSVWMQGHDEADLCLSLCGQEI